MAFDLAHILSLEQAVTAAAQALATAPNNLILAAQATLARAKKQLADAWNAYYAEMAITVDQAIGVATTSDVIGLFPVGLEAKLEPAQHRLRVRVWPEPIVQSTHDAALTALEQAAGQRYWIADAAATTEADHQAAWKALAQAHGPQRAAWIARSLTPTNLASLAPGVAPVFPQVTLEDPANPFVPTAALLPDRWVALGYRGSTRVLVHVGQPIARPLVTGLDTSAAALTAAHNVDGAPIKLPPSMRWMVDFATAVATGMALEIPVPIDLDQIDQLFVLGVRGGGMAATKDEIEKLLTGHRYGRGLAFVPQETPTNNSPTGRTGLPSPADAIAQTYTLERKPRAFGSFRSNGKQAAAAFGITADVLATAPFSGAVSRIYMESDGFEPEIARALQSILWMPLVGHFFEDLVGIDAARLDALRNHYLDYVAAAGPVPAIRVGDQPYGVLPVTAVHSFVPAAAEHIDPTLIALVQTLPKISNELRFVTHRAEDLLNFTGRPRTFLEAPMAPGTPFFSEWVGNASWLADKSGGAIAPGWAQGPLKALDGDWVYPPNVCSISTSWRPARSATRRHRRRWAPWPPASPTRSAPPRHRARS